MPKFVYNSVVDNRLLDDSDVVEDITSVGLPEIKNKVSEMDVAGLAAAFDVPDETRFEKMTFKINHNNGLNTEKLKRPGTHKIEFRLARQRMNTNQGIADYVGSKYRITCVKVSESTSDVERGNPLAGSIEYSVLRLEEEHEGKIIRIIDVLAGKVAYMGEDYGSDYKSLLE